MSTGPPSSRVLADALRDLLGPVTVDGLVRLPGGASRETWAFDAVSADGSRTELVLRRDPPGRPSEPGAMSREATVIGQAHTAGLAVPHVLAHSDGPGPWGSPGLIMRRVPGETIARRILRDDAYRGARAVLPGQLGEFAARLHALPPLATLPSGDPLAELATQVRTFARDCGWASPVFDLALRMLEAEPPPARTPVTVHGDFRLGNLIVGPQSLRAVIDWELVHLGNPAEDLGWLCVKAWRFGVDAPVAGLGNKAELLAAYRAAGGADIGLDELRWWEILGTLRWGVICMRQAWTHLSGAFRSVELAAIGRRVCEQEWDLLLLLAPEQAAEAAAAIAVPAAAPAAAAQLVDPAAATDPAAAAPFGRPTAAELIEAVREFLADEVMPATAGTLAFHARVAANVLGIVARELAMGPPAPDQELARDVAARLAIANPRYFEVTPPAP